MAIKKDSAGVEDIIFGMGTRVQLRKGSEVIMTELNGSHIPYSETQSTTQRIDQLEAEIEAPTVGLNNHVSDFNNPHQVTLAQVGAEADLGLPAVDGYVLISHLNGTREWVEIEIPLGTPTSWGEIIGLLSDQIDLQDALDLKATVVNLDAHIADEANPHTVTYTQTGAEADLGDPTVNGYMLVSQIDGTRSWVEPPTSSGAPAWGTITGTLSNQTDLDDALAAKEDWLGNPVANGYILTSQLDGTRNWVAPTTTATNWGEIVGLLSNQTDLQDALNLKAAITYVDSENATQDSVINGKTTEAYVDSENAAQNLVIADKADTTYVDSENAAQDIVINGKAPTVHTHAITDVSGLDTSLDNKVNSVTAADPGSDKILNMVSLTQVEYDSLTPVSTTVYFIVG